MPAGGGAVSAVCCAARGRQVLFLTALGSDHIGDESERLLAAQGIDVRAVRRARPQTTALTVVDPNHERTIFVVGANAHPTLDDPLGWDDLEDVDAVYFTGDDPRTLVAARAAPSWSPPRGGCRPSSPSGVEVDAIVGSANDPGEQHRPHALPVRPRAIVRTNGRNGGSGEGRRPRGTWGRSRRPGRSATPTARGTPSSPA